MTELEHIFTDALGREVALRPGTSDRQVWADTFTGLYHVPPDTMPAPRTVLDFGANIGLTAAHYRALWPDAQIVAVEMDRENVVLANRNSGLVILGNAVADQEGLAYYDDTVRAEAFALGSGGSAKAECLTVEQIIRYRFGGLLPFEDAPDDYVSPVIDFVKMDVEGMEWRLFERGSQWAPLVKHLLVELHPTGSWGGGAEHGTAGLVEMALGALEELGFDARPHPPHPQAVFATQ